MPDLEMTNLSLRLLTEREVRNVLRCMQRDHEFTEWETVGFTFMLCTRGIETSVESTYGKPMPSRKYPVIIRAGALGGDVKDVHGGWLYLTEMHARKEFREMQMVSEAYRRPQ